VVTFSWSDNAPLPNQESVSLQAFQQADFDVHPTVAFFLRAHVRRGTASGGEQSGDNQVTSALWSDNDITLWPGESQTVQVSYRAADLHGASPAISLSGWNTGKIDVVA